MAEKIDLTDDEKRVVRVFLKPMYAMFGRSFEPGDDAFIVTKAYAERLARFDSATLEQAVAWLFDNADSKDRMPYPKPCVEVAARIEASSPRAVMKRAMRALYPNGWGRAPQLWPAQELGPAPGHDGCKMGETDRREIWDDMLEQCRVHAAGPDRALLGDPNQQAMLGCAIVARLKRWDIDVFADFCPVPTDLLDKYQVPHGPNARAEYEVAAARYVAEEQQRKSGNTSTASTAG